MLLAEETEAEEVYCPVWLGVSAMVTVAVEPACSEEIVQATEPAVTVEEQLPEVALPLLNVVPAGTVPNNTTLVARSGPLLVTV
jgi:hypothetical protein